MSSTAPKRIKRGNLLSYFILVRPLRGADGTDTDLYERVGPGYLPEKCIVTGSELTVTVLCLLFPIWDRKPHCWNKKEENARSYAHNLNWRYRRDCYNTPSLRIQPDRPSPMLTPTHTTTTYFAPSYGVSNGLSA